MAVIANDVFSKLRTPKKVVREMSKKSYFRGPLERQHGKHCFNVNDKTFSIFIDHCEGNIVEKGLS